MTTDPIPLHLTELVKIRLEGHPADVALLAATLTAVLNVTDESRDHANRRGNRAHVRRYLTIGANTDD